MDEGALPGAFLNYGLAGALIFVGVIGIRAIILALWTALQEQIAINGVLTKETTALGASTNDALKDIAAMQERHGKILEAIVASPPKVTRR